MEGWKNIAKREKFEFSDEEWRKMAQVLRALAKENDYERAFMMQKGLRNIKDVMSEVSKNVGLVVLFVEQGIRKNIKFRDETFRLNPIEFKAYYRTVQEKASMDFDQIEEARLSLMAFKTAISNLVKNEISHLVELIYGKKV